MKKVVFLQGPTASGKSDLALRLAQEIPGEIINCDSVQVYKGLDIGSAKPSAKEMELCPHHLYSIVEKGGAYTAGDFVRDAHAVIHKSTADLFYVVGGTGFYFQAFESGMYEGEKTSASVKAKVEEAVNQLGLAAMYEDLKVKDPLYAEKISQNDTYRILRAHEVLLEGNLPSSLQNNKKKADFPYPLLKLYVNQSRADLRPKVEKRTQKMLEMGLIEEVRLLLSEGFSDWDALQSVGYKEVVAFLQGDLEEARLKEAIVTKTMQLIKKQQTWFKRDPSSHSLLDKDYSYARDLVKAFQN